MRSARLCHSMVVQLNELVKFDLSGTRDKHAWKVKRGDRFAATKICDNCLGISTVQI